MRTDPSIILLCLFFEKTRLNVQKMNAPDDLPLSFVFSPFCLQTTPWLLPRRHQHRPTTKQKRKHNEAFGHGTEDLR